MEVSTTLIVMLMFTSIVGIGVGHILITLASLVSNFVSLRTRFMGTSWSLILLITFLSMFWNGTVLAQRDEWTFALFLFAISGPVALLFASNLISELLRKNIETGESEEVVAPSLLARFFWVFALAQLWVVGMDFVLGNGWTVDTWVSVALAGIAAALALANSQKMRRWFTVAMLIATVVDVVRSSL